MKIVDYAVETLKMNISHQIKNEHIGQLQIRHLKSLWSLLVLNRAIMLTKNSHDPFYDLVKGYKEDMGGKELEALWEETDDDEDLQQEKKLIKYLNKGPKVFNPKNLLTLLDLFFQYMTKLAVTSSSGPAKDQTIHNALTAFNDEKEKEAQEFSNPENTSEDEDEEANFYISRLNAFKTILQTFELSGIHLKHIYFIWKLLAKSLNPPK